MKKYILPLFLSLVCACGQKTVESFPEPVFEEHFQDSTLRLDYVFCGDALHQAIYLQGMHKTGPWAGRQKNLDRLPLKGNGQLYVKDSATGATLYAHSFSTLFQEWVGYPEARQVQKAFENCFQVPFPKDSVRIEITLCDNRGKESARLSHIVGVYEGGGYQSKGVYRPVQECRMKINECEDFCPVCVRALERMIDFYTK